MREENINKVREEIQKIQHRAADFEQAELRVLSEEDRTAELSFSSEKPVTRWYGEEVLSHKAGAVKLERINSTGCLLFNHDRNRVIGKVVKARIKGRRGVATVQFDEDEESTIIFNKVRSGSLRGTSVSYIIHEMERRSKKEQGQTRDIYTATSWEPTEISIVSVPADPSVGVGRSIIEADTGSLNRFKHQLKINENILTGGRK